MGKNNGIRGHLWINCLGSYPVQDALWNSEFRIQNETIFGII
jgi:hypothetical protein